jgi:hypothetical protein
MLGMLLHLPVDVFGQSTGQLYEVGNGWRLTGRTSGGGPVLVIDDTVMTGNSFKDITPKIKAKYPDALFASVYCNPYSRRKPDFWSRDLSWPHLLEWNMFNSVVTPQMATDFDGILCHDCRLDQDDDGSRYVDFLQNVKPLYLTRRVPIPLVVTARLEKYRPQTLAWLSKHGVSVGELVMAPWKTLRERNRHDMGEFKAEHFIKFMKKRHVVNPPIFVESDGRQAQTIAEITGGIVVCPAAARCYYNVKRG